MNRIARVLADYWTPRGRRSDVAAGGSKAATHGHTNVALGARTSPFVSFWYVGNVPKAVRQQLRERERERRSEAQASAPRVASASESVVARAPGEEERDGDQQRARICWTLDKLPPAVRG